MSGWVLAALLGQLALDAGVGRPRVHVFELPAVEEVVEVAGPTIAGGIPVLIHAVKSRLGVEALSDHLLSEFARVGLYVPPSHHLTALTELEQLTGFDPQTRITYTIFLQPNEDGTTTVLLTEAFAGNPVAEPASLDWAPVMPGAEGLLTTRSEGVEVAAYKVKATLEDVRTFHTQVLREAGYAEEAPGEWVKEERLLRFTFTPDPKASAVRVHVLSRRALSTLPVGPEP